jgi:plasmid stabilization system protein ParE
MKVTRLPSFWRDLQGIVDYFCDAKEEKKAVRFARAVDETIDFIERFPDAGNPWESPDPDLAKMRFRLVKRFRRYLVVYERVKKEVVIHRVFHGSQNIEAILKG